MYTRVHPISPEPRKIAEVVNCLKNGGLIIYPTDTIYGIGCDIHNEKAIQKLYQLKGVTQKNAQFSFLCKDISDFSQYTRNLDTPIFRLLKKCVPGPYTFILEASKEVPRLLKTKKNTVGLRIPDNTICQALISALGNPIISTSLPQNADVDEYVDPEIFYDIFKDKVDMVIDGGVGQLLASTVIDVSKGYVDIIREGAGDIAIFED